MEDLERNEIIEVGPKEEREKVSFLEEDAD